MRTLLLTALLLTAACGHVSMGDALATHDVQYPEKVGTTEYMQLTGGQKVIIHWMLWDAAHEACLVVLPYTDAASCMSWRNGTVDGDIFASESAKEQGDAPLLPAGFHCVGWLVPNDQVLKHELDHCIEEVAL